MKLYDAAVSGNCHKVRMMLSLLGLDYDQVLVDLKAGAQKQPEFLALNPLGKIPVLEDEGLVIRDSQAILVYLAGKHGSPDWWPEDAPGQGQIMQWLAFSVNEMFHGPAIARGLVIFGRKGDLAAAQEKARAALDVLEGRLGDHDWLALDRSTIADIACYPYAGLVPMGKVSLAPYPALRAWLQRVEALPGYLGMDGLPSQPGLA